MARSPSIPGTGRGWERLGRFLKLGAYSRVTKLRAASDEERAPFLLIVGSLSDCTYVDALAYARGVAQQHVLAAEYAWVRVLPQVDRNRFVYEIHDGGEGFSVLPHVLAELEKPEVRSVRLRLANGAMASIEETEDASSLFTLIFADALEIEQQGGEHGEPLRIEDVPYAHRSASAEQMRELFPQNYRLASLGGAAISVGLGLFILSGALWLADSAHLLGEQKFASAIPLAPAAVKNNPSLQLERAKAGAQPGTYIAKLSYIGGRWSTQYEKNTDLAGPALHSADEKPGGGLPSAAATPTNGVSAENKHPGPSKAAPGGSSALAPVSVKPAATREVGPRPAGAGKHTQDEKPGDLLPAVVAPLAGASSEKKYPGQAKTVTGAAGVMVPVTTKPAAIPGVKQ